MTKSYNNCMFLCFGNKIRIFREEFPNIIPFLVLIGQEVSRFFF